MRVITLIGETGAGKTQTITELYKYLCGNGAKEHLYSEEGSDKNDFKAFITFADKKIALCSIGYIADYGHLFSEYILSGIAFASKNEADVLINAYTEPFPEFPESIYEAIIGKCNYNPISINASNHEEVKNQIIKIVNS